MGLFPSTIIYDQIFNFVYKRNIPSFHHKMIPAGNSMTGIGDHWLCFRAHTMTSRMWENERSLKCNCLCT